MQNSTIVLLINDSVRALKGVYEPKGVPEYFKTLDPSITVGDLVVVETSTRHGFTVVEITETDVTFDFDNPPLVRWITNRVDTEGYDKILAQEAEAINAVQAAERNRKKAELRASIFADNTEQMKALEITNLSEE